MSESWVDPVKYTSRPEGARTPREMAVYDLLERLEVPYVRLDHAQMKTIADCREVDRILEIAMSKNLFLCNSQKSRFYLLMMPGEKKFQTRVLSDQIGSARLSFADSEYMEEFLEISPGSVSVLGLMNDRDNQVQLLIDRDVYEREALGCHPCVNTSSLRISMEDLLKIILPAIHHEPMVVNL